LADRWYCNGWPQCLLVVGALYNINRRFILHKVPCLIARLKASKGKSKKMENSSLKSLLSELIDGLHANIEEMQRDIVFSSREIRRWYWGLLE
jgi:hypothetical protein